VRSVEAGIAVRLTKPEQRELARLLSKLQGEDEQEAGKAGSGRR
jgi:hypothetical protein